MESPFYLNEEKTEVFFNKKENKATRVFTVEGVKLIPDPLLENKPLLQHMAVTVLHHVVTQIGKQETLEKTLELINIAYFILLGNMDKYEKWPVGVGHAIFKSTYKDGRYAISFKEKEVLVLKKEGEDFVYVNKHMGVLSLVLLITGRHEIKATLKEFAFILETFNEGILKYDEFNPYTFENAKPNIRNKGKKLFELDEGLKTVGEVGEEDSELLKLALSGEGTLSPTLKEEDIINEWHMNELTSDLNTRYRERYLENLLSGKEI